MGKPAARIGDLHNCPKLNPGTNTPHVGGVIIGPGCSSVLIGGLPAAVAGDTCDCVGEPDKVTGGSTGVFIGGKPAVRKEDKCEHGGVVTGGFESVLIGERKKTCRSKRKEPSVKEKIEIINQTIEHCVVVLEYKLKMLLGFDRQLFRDFEKWFGPVTKRNLDIILKRIRSTLEVCKDLSAHDFELIHDSIDEKIYGYVYRIKGSRPKIHLGIKFWKIESGSEKSRTGVIIHELSHFKNIGKTDDFAYGTQGCLGLAKHYPKEALYNADSFELFING